MNIKQLLIIFILFFSTYGHASFITNLGFNYQTESSNSPDFTFSSIKLHGLFGSMLGKSGKLVLGTNFIYQINSSKTSTNNSFNSLEFGPKVV